MRKKTIQNLRDMYSQVVNARNVLEKTNLLKQFKAERLEYIRSYEPVTNSAISQNNASKVKSQNPRNK
jgi:predicted SAM-dependent methyltransferase